MQVLLNTTTLLRGGPLQTSSAFIVELVADPAGIQWHLAISAAVADQLRKLQVELPAATTVFDESPAQSKPQRARLAELETKISPDCVLTFSGPSYVKFRAPHVLGCSEPWVTVPTLTAYRSLRFPKEWAYFWFASAYKQRWFRHADAWVTQTEATRQGLHRRCRVPLEQIAVIPNTCGEHYRSRDEIREIPVAGECVRMLCFAVAYRHKNIDLLPIVAQHLERLLPGRDFRFVVTLPPDHAITRELFADAAKRGVSHRIENRGPIPVADGPALYRDCHVCFLPTVLEAFSATYIEAMTMGLPVVTTDLDFAHSVCHDAALYFRARDAAAAARTLAKLLTDSALWNELVERGKQIPRRLPTPRERYLSYVSVVQAAIARRPVAAAAHSSPQSPTEDRLPCT
jgi:glycosyltransferase involved in cell wall biosynthesis